MEQEIVIKYDPIERIIKIEKSDFTTFEAFGILEAAKVMIAQDWIEE